MKIDRTDSRLSKAEQAQIAALLANANRLEAAGFVGQAHQKRAQAVVLREQILAAKAA